MTNLSGAKHLCPPECPPLRWCRKVRALPCESTSYSCTSVTPVKSSTQMKYSPGDRDSNVQTFAIVFNARTTITVYPSRVFGGDKRKGSASLIRLYHVKQFCQLTKPLRSGFQEYTLTSLCGLRVRRGEFRRQSTQAHYRWRGRVQAWRFSNDRDMA